MYFKHTMMIYEVKGEVKTAKKYNDQTLRKVLLERASSWNLPITNEDINIDWGYDSIVLSIDYQIEKTFFTRYSHLFLFQINSSGPLPPDRYR